MVADRKRSRGPWTWGTRLPNGTFVPANQKPSDARDGALARYVQIRSSAALGTNERILLLVLATYADANGKSFPSLDTLAVDTGMSVPRVRRAIERAERLGWLTCDRSRDGHSSNRYCVTPVPTDDRRVVDPGGEQGDHQNSAGSGLTDKSMPGATSPCPPVPLRDPDQTSGRRFAEDGRCIGITAIPFGGKDDPSPAT